MKNRHTPPWRAELAQGDQKRALKAILTLLGICAAAFPAWGGCVESNPGRHVADSETRISMNDSSALPIAPEGTLKVLRDSDVVAYARINTVEDKIEKVPPSDRPQPDILRAYPRQRCTITLLWILKGDATWEGKTVPLLKERSRYFVSEKEKMVLYLKRQGDFFHTIDGFGEEHRLAFVLCDIRNSKKDSKSGGIVASVNGNGMLSRPRPTIHVLEGRQRTTLRIGDDRWNTSLLQTKTIGEFDICEIPLDKGTYTVLMEEDGQLFSYTRLLKGYYACVNVGEYRWWEPLCFRID